MRLRDLTFAGVALAAAAWAAPMVSAAPTVWSARPTDRGDAAAAPRASADDERRIEDIRRRFRALGSPLRKHEAAPVPVLRAGRVREFEAAVEGQHAAVVATKRTVRRSASVRLPAHADGRVLVVDDTSGVRASFAMEGAAPSALRATRDGLALYRAAASGADVVHRVTEQGTEDFVLFERRPAREEIVYRVDVSAVPGLRLVEDVLEMLAEDGTPALRVASPYVVAEGGARAPAKLDVEGCAYDTDPSAPWGRPVTPPGASTCRVRVSWRSSYPALVDPAWTATGSMVSPRVSHSATLLSSGRVLMAGGFDGANPLSSAELFDGTSTFAVTGSLVAARGGQTATLLTSGKVLLAGGYQTFYLASAELFDGTGTFAATGSMTSARGEHTATALPSGKVLVAGGNSGSTFVTTAELFSGAAFTATGPMKVARGGHTATLLASGKVLIAGGSANSAELFDGTSTFALTGSMTANRIWHQATRLASNKVLLVGGDGESSAEVFDGTSAFTAVGSMSTAREDFTATLLPAGQVLVAGGGDECGGSQCEGPCIECLGTAELFDGTSTFTPTSDMALRREDQSATLLPSGKVLIAGGYDPYDGMESEAELFAVAAPGDTCGVGGDCASGVCADGICCTSACPNGGVCQRCVSGTGACQTITSADDPDNCKGTSTCSASGACRAKNGQAETDPAQCASGFVSDGVCCDAACDGACDVCVASAGAAANGTCTPAPAGSPGAPACGSEIACNGASSACAAICATDLDCLAGSYCSASGACTPQRAQGAACAPTADCKSTPCRECPVGCVDGVCCATSACPTCEACAAALQAPGGGDGVCSAALADSDPHDDCPVDPGFPTSCLADGNCDGAGACRKYAHASVACNTTSCIDGQTVTGHLCDGTGSCQMSAATSCSPYACTAGQCAARCSGDADCFDATFYCSAAQTCDKRVGRSGACATTDACEAGATCVDGVCCDSSCTGLCEACNVSGHEGTCSPVPAGPPPEGKKSCGGEPGCAGSCDGSNGASCAFPFGAACGTTCASGEETDSSCGANGRCVASAPTKCSGGYGCGDQACNTSCGSDHDCVDGYRCRGGACVSGSRCVDGDSASLGSDGTTPCAPFLCDPKNGVCFTACSSVDQCADAAVCTSGACVASAAAASPSPSGESGGCALAPDEREGDRSGAAWIASGALLAWARRRGRRARSTRRSPIE